MDPVNIVDNVYKQVKTSLTERLTAQGYQPVHEQHHDPVFNSRYIIWSNNREAMRFTWDGKENWFILEITEMLPLTALSPWDEIIVVPFDAESDWVGYQEHILKKIISSID